MKLARKKIEVTITLANGQFSQNGSNTVTLKNHQVVANIANAGGEAMGALQMRIYGLTQTIMNQLTVVGPIAAAVRGQNKITIAAGDDENGLKTVYSGVIDQAWGDYHGAPDILFNLIAFAGLDAAIKPAESNSYKGSTSVATMMEKLAKTAGLTFENNGVAATLNDQYFPGTVLNQIRDCARAANINYLIDRGVLAIWPSNGFRAGQATVVSPETGLVGYPSFTSNGLTLLTLFNPDLRLGGQVKVNSSIPAACGIWTIFSVSHALETERDGGSWFSQIECVPSGQ